MNALDMSDAKKKLANYGDDDLTKAFAAELGSRLNPQLVPEGVNMVIQLLFYDMDTGHNGFSGKPIPSVLTGQPQIIFAILESVTLPRLIADGFPADFAAEIVKFQAEQGAGTA